MEGKKDLQGKQLYETCDLGAAWIIMRVYTAGEEEEEYKW